MTFCRQEGMCATHVVDLSFAPGEQQDLADLPFDVELLNGERAEDVQELNISHAHVLVLTSAPEAPINDILQFVRVLRASHNEISNLRGLEVFVSLEVLDLSYNALRVVDAHAATLLRSLKRLHTIDFSHNQMNLFDLDGSFGAPSARSAGQNGGAAGSPTSSFSAPGAGRRLSSSSVIHDAAPGMTALAAINLSHNAFIEIPDLRSAPFLQVVNISHNRLEDATDMDVRLPSLSLHTLQLHANRLPNATALVPLCALAATLKHIQVYDNPFTFVSGSAAEGVDMTLWWRPFLLFLCPLLNTVDQTEFTVSERRVAMRRLFRKHGALSRNLLEYMNVQNKETLETYLKQQSDAAEPPADALAVIEELKEEEEQDAAMPSRAREGAAAGSESEIGDSEYTTDVIVPMSRMNTVREQGVAESIGAHTSPYWDPNENMSPSAGVEAANTPSTRTSTRVVIVDPNSQPSNSSIEGILVMNHNRQRTKTVPIATVVRALQQKTRTLEEVVTVLWRSDLARRRAAAVVIQRHIRGALARMHLSEYDAESCRFIRYQLQHTAAVAKAQRAHPAAGAATGLSRCSNTRTTGVHHTRQSSIEAIEASGSSIEEVLVSMRSLQEVMNNMWVDLEEYRAMADREQRRAAILIQRRYRGYCARRDFGRVRLRSASPSSPLTTVVPPCKCAGRTASLQKEVTELRHEVRELRELLAQTARHQRLAAYENPEKAMDDIVRKHEARVSEDRNQAKNIYLHVDSRSPSATPSITVADAVTSQERGLRHSTPRGEGPEISTAHDEMMEAGSRSSSQFNIPLHRMPQQLSVQLSPPVAYSAVTNTSADVETKQFAKITKRRRGDVASPHALPLREDSVVSTD
ncbi:putative Leucine rich repeat protein [Leptomonas seymouri]|uniref:Putative Leucine rich repeat protein n=1 Tax=Leptomonas seymouri TaxID=5684 RepID=A0A0N1I0J5_LEPSE|nr:putative Leucine rich repeat protein [Leptomonas seymouri]|eukprot:KPI84305.1 putative Leucine rich repeat protein [Leptomonas seymouri]